MNKRTANLIAARLYRDAMTRAKFETTQDDYHAVYYPEYNSVVVTWYHEKKDENFQHVCPVRKAWMY